MTPRDEVVTRGVVAEEALAARLSWARETLDAAAPGRPVRLVAVTKGFGLAAVTAALRLGVRDFGENYPAELLAKAEGLAAGVAAQADLLGEPVRWHFLGEVQRNKVARLAPVVDLWHGVDREEEGLAIAHRSTSPMLVQVDYVGRPGRQGISPALAGDLVSRLRDQGVAVAGLMTVAPPGGPEKTASVFAAAAQLAADLGLDELSMGMSDDFEVAARQGATMVRIGRALFGERPGPGMTKDAPRER
ncbi:MAG: YggS family pyridoxal phosphate enzyme [Acidimicrobiales bacterium]